MKVDTGFNKLCLQYQHLSPYGEIAVFLYERNFSPYSGGFKGGGQLGAVAPPSTSEASLAPLFSKFCAPFGE